MTKTTKKDFELFEKECWKWVEFFGLKEWELLILHEDLEEGWASCSSGYKSKTADIKLCTEWDTERPLIASQIKQAAFHEVCHLLLWDLSVIGQARFVCEDEFENKTHEIISKLINSVFKNLTK